MTGLRASDIKIPMKPKIMLAGLGSLGETLLQFLARQDFFEKIAVGSLLPKEAEAKCNLARLSAMAQGYTPDISFFPLDLKNKEAVMEAVSRKNPDVILSTASLQPWWLPGLLPPEAAALINKAGFGVWLPFHLTLALKLMEALHEIGYSGITLIASFPDVVNCVLGRLHRAASCGIGNLDEIVPKLKILAAGKLKASPGDIRVYLVGHHALESYAFGKSGEKKPPYFLRIEHLGRNVTGEVNGEELLFAPYDIPPGTAIHYLTAGSAVRLIRALFAEEESLLHAPSPHGLPGGYPVIVSREKIGPAEIPGLSLKEAVAINERSHSFDGIETIEEDGTVVFCRQDTGVLKQAFGYDCPRLHPSEAESRADELWSRFRRFAGSYGVTI